MPDITMCKGGRCPIKETCFRFTAKPDKYQSYFVKAPWKIKNKKAECEYYWKQEAKKGQAE